MLRLAKKAWRCQHLGNSPPLPSPPPPSPHPPSPSWTKGGPQAPTRAPSVPLLTLLCPTAPNCTSFSARRPKQRVVNFRFADIVLISEPNFRFELSVAQKSTGIHTHQPIRTHAWFVGVSLSRGSSEPCLLVSLAFGMQRPRQRSNPRTRAEHAVLASHSAMPQPADTAPAVVVKADRGMLR